jgi:pyruvate formate lyase activating enzyme
VVPGLNDSSEELRDIARFIAAIDPGIPWHISRFFPAYHADRTGATPAEKLREACRIGVSEGLHHVYLGNVLGESGDVVCPRCSRVVVERLYGGAAPAIHIDRGRCAFCGQQIGGVFP